MLENNGITQQIFEKNVKIRKQNKRKIKEYRPDLTYFNHHDLPALDRFIYFPREEAPDRALPGRSRGTVLVLDPALLLLLRVQDGADGDGLSEQRGLLRGAVALLLGVRLRIHTRTLRVQGGRQLTVLSVLSHNGHDKSR